VFIALLYPEGGAWYS